MSGHSKWATTKHKKAVVDQRRGKLFAKLIKSIEVAARTGGGDPAGNPTLADAIAKARGSSVPSENIERAVKRGSGEVEGGVRYEEVTYEARVGEVALLISCLTENRNRAAAEVRTAVTRRGGRVADPGSVLYLFSRQGIVIVSKDAGGVERDEDDILLVVLEAGAEEVSDIGDAVEVQCALSMLSGVRQSVEGAGLDVLGAEVVWVPKVRVGVEGEEARRVEALVEALEELDDVQEVWGNFEVEEERGR